MNTEKAGKFLTLLVTIGATLDTVIGVILDNQGLLIELGVSPKLTKIIMLVGLVIAAVTKPLTEKFIGGSNPPPKKDEK